MDIALPLAEDPGSPPPKDATNGMKCMHATLMHSSLHGWQEICNEDDRKGEGD